MSSAQILIIQLGQTGPEYMFPAKQRMMGEDQPGDIHVQLVVSVRVFGSSDVAVDVLGL